eukprot:1753898-Rhodomonas_salina.2
MCRTRVGTDATSDGGGRSSGRMGVGGSAATTTPTAATMVLRSPGGWAAALDMDSPHGSAVVDWDKSFEDHHDAPRRLTAVDHRRCCAGRVATAGGCRYVEGRVQGQSASSKRRRSRTCLRNCSALSTKVGLGIMIMVPRYQGSAARSVAGHTLARVYLGTLNDTLTWVPGNTLCCVLQLEGTSGNLNAFNGWNLNLNAFNGDYSTNPSGWYTEEDPKEIHTSTRPEKNSKRVQTSSKQAVASAKSAKSTCTTASKNSEKYPQKLSLPMRMNL